MKPHKQAQNYNGYTYTVSQIIDIAKDLPVETVDIRAIAKFYEFMEKEYDIVDFVDTMERVMDSDLKYPILIYRGFIMDGKHRVAKALLEKKKTIRVKFLEELPAPKS